MPHDTTTYLKYANLQMAAEAILSADFTGVIPRDTLALGNNRSSKFANVLADRFVADGWTVLAHKANTSTGFSGTLFENSNTKELVLSFRSTEFQDDNVRDSKATNELEIRDLGWAFGQIDDMEIWYRSLKDRGLIDRPVSVTGYSLGGHLATAFNLLRQEEGQSSAIAATYTFNGAGVGALKPDVRLTDVIRNFDLQRRNASGNEVVFTDPRVRSLYSELRTRLTGGVAPTEVELNRARALLASTINGREERLLKDALERVAAVMREVSYVSTVTNSGPGGNPLLPPPSQIEATRLDYQLADLLAGGRTESYRSSLPLAGLDGYTSRNPHSGLDRTRFFDIYGNTVPSSVSNSQYHYGAETPIFIEDQPLWRGSLGLGIAGKTLAAFVAEQGYLDAKLLVNQFSINDFGDTHSLVLLVDSLAIQSALAALDSTVGSDTLDAVLKAASNASKQEGGGVDGQGKAEGDALENVLNALGKIFLGPTAPTIVGNLEGGTWANVGDRNAFFDRLKAVQDDAAYKELVNKVEVSRLPGASGLSAAARTDFASFLSLLNLSPFVLKARAADVAQVEASMGRGWGATYTNWLGDKRLTRSERETGSEAYTAKWIEDRSTLLDWMLLRNDINAQGIITPLMTKGRPIAEASNLEDKESALQILLSAGTIDQRKRIVFGSAAADSFSGYDKGDHLYGGAGSDALRGNAGDDYLEGNAGADTLYGGADDDTLLGGAGEDSLEGGVGSDVLKGGSESDILDGGTGNDILYGGDGRDVLDGGIGNDTLYGGADKDGYFFAAGWGRDTIEDSDGEGAIEVAGYGKLTGAGAIKDAPNEWTSADKRVKFTVAPVSAGKSELKITFLDGTGTPIADSIRIDNWTSGNLGISLGGTVEAPVTDRTYVGDFQKLIDDGRFVIDIDHNYVGAGSVDSADDVITGSNGADLILGINGNDALAGLDGDDDIEGGDGDDFILGGSGEDTLNGGLGRDVIFGSGWGGLVLPASPDEPPPVADGPELSRGFSWVWWLNVDFDANGFQTYQGRGGDYETRFDDGNLIDGGAGGDWLFGATGQDTIYGGEGNDDITGSAGQDTLFGDEGDDRIDGDGIATLGYIETVLAADQAADLLVGGAGNDTLYGDGGDDELYGGDDDDRLFGDETNPKVTPFANHGNDYLNGGAGNDQLTGGGRDDELFGGTGNDTLYGDGDLDALDGEYHGDDYLDGEEGDDAIEGGGGADTLYGGEGSDMLWGDVSGPGLKSTEYGEDYLYGEDGADTLLGGGNADYLFGGDGDDVLLGEGNLDDLDVADHGADYLDGGAGNDTLQGDGGGDTLLGGDGNDLLLGDNDALEAADHGEDFLEGGGGADTLDGNGGADCLDGGEGNDKLFGSAGNDYLDGGAGDDYLDGGDGDDTLVGGGGTEVMRGGAGDDTYVIATGESPLGTIGESEAIVDNEGTNRIVFEGAGSSGTRVVADASGTLQVSIAEGQSIVVQNGVAGTIGKFQFGDGRTYTESELIGSFSEDAYRSFDNDGRTHHVGGRRNDTLTSTAGRSIVSGGRGNDTLAGSGGNNTYRFSRGDGSDLLTDSSAKVDADGNAAANRIEFGAGIGQSEIRLTGATGALRIQVGADPGDGIRLGSFDQTSIGAVSPIDTFVFADGSTLSYADLVAFGFHGGAGDEVLSATAGNDVLDGAAGDDTLFGQAGDDTLTGGAGNDMLSAGAGNDRYVFAAGDGRDVIDNRDAAASDDDALVLNDIAPADVVLSADGSDLLVKVRDSDDQVRIVGHFDAGAIDRIEFGDGTVWTEPDIAARLDASFTDGADNVVGTSGDDIFFARGGNDTVRGLGGADAIDGGDGNDILSGDAGNDSLDGGAGNDQLRGGAGDDVFVFGRGYGQDTVFADDVSATKTDAVVFRAGTRPADVRVARSGNDVHLAIAGTADVLLLKSYLYDEGDTPSRIEEIRFADGTVWDVDAVKTELLKGTSGNDVLDGFDRRADVVDAKEGNDTVRGYGGADTLSGGAGNDYLDGGNGDDVLDGGTGFDYLYGGAGNDTLAGGENAFGGLGDDRYVLAGGFGPVTIDDAGGAADALVLAATDSPATLRAENWGADLLLWAGGSTVRVQRQFTALGSEDGVEQIRFADGTAWTQADIFARLPVNNLSDAADWANGFAWNDTINAGGGDDRIAADFGDDLVDGGTGNDVLYGGPGNDVLIGGQGADTLAGDDGNDSLAGGAGVDSLSGGAGDDTLAGDAGDDILAGELGDDTYLLGRASGRDGLFDSGGIDRIVFEAGVAQADVTLFRVGNDLRIAIGRTEAQTRVASWFAAPSAAIERFEFADGSAWDAAAIAARIVAGTPNAMVGTPDNDTFVVDDVGDTIAEEANAGNDTVLASVDYTLGANLENLTLTGYVDIDATGNALDNRIVGNEGNNVFDGKAGRDTLVGGAGDDSYYAHADTAAIVEEAGGGVDTVFADFHYTLPVNVENLRASTLNGGYVYGVRLTGNALDNTIVARSSPSPGAFAGVTNDTIDGGLGADTMISGALDDTFYVDNPGDVIVASSAHVFSSIDWTLANGHSQLTLIGAAATTGVGNAGANVLDGSASNAANLLIGGAGDDFYRVGLGDQVVEGAGEGFDTVELAYTPADSTFRIDALGGASVERYVVAAEFVDGRTVVGSDRPEEIAFGRDSTGVFLSGSDRIFGFGGNDTLRGSGGDNLLDGGDGDDLLIADTGRRIGANTLIGGSGADTLQGSSARENFDGGSGDDIVFGGVGDDVYRFGFGDGHDIVNGGNEARAGKLNVLRFKAGVAPGDVQVRQVGDDLVVALGASDGITVRSFFLGDNPSNAFNPLQRIEFADGTAWGIGAIRLKAHPDLTNSSPVLMSPIADFAGREGEPIDFRLPADTFADPDAGDALALSATLADGRPLPAGLSFFQGEARFVGMLVAGSFSVRVTATDYAGLSVSDVFEAAIAAPESKTFVGTAGNDSLIGMSGDDTLIGLAGRDYLDGRAGRDSMIGGTGDDYYQVDNIGDVVVENADEGSDAVASSVSYALPANVENLYFYDTAGGVSGTGNAGANVIQGTAYDDRLDGGGGADTLVGEGGNDTFVVDDPGDSISAGYGTYSIVESSVSYTLPAGLQELRLVGSASIDGTGNGSSNVINGNAAANRIDGRGGYDTLAGGAGDDTYVVDSLATITELPGGGIDTVEATSWTLGANLENLKLTGGSALYGGGTGIGNELANSITGTAWNDYIDGKAGADTMSGGAGNDRYEVGDIGDVVIEAAGGGTDQVDSSITLTLVAEVEKLALLGSANLDGTGNSLANVLVGNSGSNRLDGGAGADTMSGGLGDDTYAVDNIGDVTDEQPGAGFDSVESQIAWTLANEIERLVLIGSASVSATGNAANNVLVGNVGANRLDGGGGADTMSGGTGDDTYVVDNAGDSVVELAGEGSDSIESSVAITLAAAVENLTLNGNQAIDGTGNELANRLVGNAAANRLVGAAGNDTLDGGAGADVLDGGAGDDTYVFGRGYGADTISSLDSGAGKVDVLQLGAAIGASDLLLSRDVDDLLLSIQGTADSIRVLGHFAGGSASGRQVDRIRFADGSSWDTTAIQSLVSTNRPPSVAMPIPDKFIRAGDPFNFTVSPLAFKDQDPADILTFSASTATGQALPAWLSFNAPTRTFSGSSTSANVGTTSVRVTATDPQGASAIDDFDLTVRASQPRASVYGTPGNDYLGAYGIFDTVFYAGAGNDYLYGGVGDDYLYGEAGNDYLSGGDGIDTMDGGLGDDHYVVDSVDDRIWERVNEGIDDVLSSVDYTLPANVEKLYLTTGASRGTGNELANSIDTSPAVLNDVILDGGPGADTLFGSFGNDIYVVDNVGDVVSEYFSGPAGPNLSVDLIKSSVTYALPSGIENLVLTGTAAIDGGGNLSANSIVGNFGSNRLNGLDGNDTLDGGWGKDTLDGGAGDDTYLFGRNYGTDLVSSIDRTVGKTDTLQIASDITRDEIFLRRDGSDLLVSLGVPTAVQEMLGTANLVRVFYQFVSSANQVDRIRFGDGAILTAASVQSALASSGGAWINASLVPSQSLSAPPIAKLAFETGWEGYSSLAESLPVSSSLDPQDRSPTRGQLRPEPAFDPVSEASLVTQASGLLEAMALFSPSGGAGDAFTPIPLFHALPVVASPLAA